jgi:hypothetical protein
MNKHIHLDLEEDIRELLESRAQSTVFRAICGGDPKALEELHRSESGVPLRVDSYAKVDAGPRQVESLLRFMVEGELERALEDAEADNVVYEQLGEHRILGRAKKKKKGKSRGY